MRVYNWFVGFVAGVLLAGVWSSSATAETICADFRLYGTTWRNSLATDTKLEVEIKRNGVVLESGGIYYDVGGAVSKTGVLSDVPTPGLNNWGIIDKSFSVDIEMNVNEPLSLSIRLSAGGIRAVWGFTPNMTLPDDPAEGNPLKGLQMTDIHFADGRPLSAENMAFAFIPETTRLRAGFSLNGVFHNAEDTLNDTNLVSVSEYPGYASAEITGANLLKLGVNPDPNPYVIDGSNGIIDGLNGTANNARLILVPEPSSFLLAVIGGAGLLALRVRRRSRAVKRT